MAIQSNFDLDRANRSQSYAYQCWYNYYYGDNSMNISKSDMSKITATWSSELRNWKANADNDENKYEIEDDDFDAAKAAGREQAVEATGYSGGSGGMITNGVFDAGSSLFTFAGGKIVAQGMSKLGCKFTENAAGELCLRNKKDKVLKISDIATVIMAAAVAAKYWISKPNKEQVDACNELQSVMNDSQSALTMAQSDMEIAQNELLDLSDEAAETNEDSNDEIEENKTEFDMYMETFNALMQKLESGDPLTEDEQALLNELLPVLQELGVTIEDVVNNAGEIVNEIYETMGSYQEWFDNAAQTIAEVQGVTDFAESFDSATRTMCYVEGASQTLNAYSAGTAAARLTGKLFVGWIFAAMGAAAAVSSGLAANQQCGFGDSYASQVGTEIDLRKTTQDMDVQTDELYVEGIDNYDYMMGGVEDLELEVPDEDEMEVPEETPVIPTGSEGGGTTTSGGFGLVTGSASGSGNSGSGGSNNPNKKDEDKK